MNKVKLVVQFCEETHNNVKLCGDDAVVNTPWSCIPGPPGTSASWWSKPSPGCPGTPVNRSMHCTPLPPFLKSQTGGARINSFFVLWWMWTRQLCHHVPAWRKFFGVIFFFFCTQTDLSWLARLCQASGPPVCVIRRGRRSGSKRWLLASQMRCRQPVWQRECGTNSQTWNISTPVCIYWVFYTKFWIPGKVPVKEDLSPDWYKNNKISTEPI